MYSFQKFLKTLSSENDQLFNDCVNTFRTIFFENYEVIQLETFSSVFYLKKQASDKFVPVLKHFKREQVVQKIKLSEFKFLNNFENFKNNKYSIQSSIFEEIISSIEKKYQELLKESGIKYLSFQRSIQHVFRTNKLRNILFLKPYFLEHFNQETGKFKQRNIEFFSSKIHYFNFSFYKSEIHFKLNSSLKKDKDIIKLLKHLIEKYPEKENFITSSFNGFSSKFRKLIDLIQYNSKPLFKNIMLKHLFNIGLNKAYRIDFEKEIMFSISSAKKNTFNCPKAYKTDTMYKHFFYNQVFLANRYSDYGLNPVVAYKQNTPLKHDISFFSFKPEQVNHLLDYCGNNFMLTNYLLYFLSKNMMQNFSLENLKNIPQQELVDFYLKEAYGFSFEKIIFKDENIILEKNLNKLNHIKGKSINETILFSYLNTVSYKPLKILISLFEKLSKREYIILLHIFVHLIKSSLSIEVFRKNNIGNYHQLAEQIIDFFRYHELIKEYSDKDLLVHFKAIKNISNFNSKIEYFSNV